MQEFTRSQRWTALLAGQRRRLAVLGVPLLTLMAVSGALPVWVLLFALITQMALLFWATDGVFPLRGSGSMAGCASVQDRESLDASFSALPPGTHSAALALFLDDADRLTHHHGERLTQALLTELGQRLARALREQDGFCRLPASGFGVALFPQRGIDLGSVLAVSQRIQTRLAHPFHFDGVSIWPTVSIGFCLSRRAASLNGLSMLDAAEQAARRARLDGPAGMSSYSVSDFPTSITGDRLDELRSALETGEFVAFFQPQVRTDSGKVCGMEALARWRHPTRGLIPPAEFLPQIEAAGLLPKLAQCMLRDALAALAEVSKGNQAVPCVSINLSAQDLRKPGLTDEIAWELDRHDLSPDRLTIEILESVVANGDDDVAVRNIARLAGLGCGIDLDDFGTGHASIANIRRFAVGRIKIDRSFITNLHRDPEQEQMVAAILSMAEQLDLMTLAEGVECAEEQVRLAQMGCDHLQGFAIARPMPREDLKGWLDAHDKALNAGEPWCEDLTPPRVAVGSGR